MLKYNNLTILQKALKQKSPNFSELCNFSDLDGSSLHACKVLYASVLIHKHPLKVLKLH